MKPVLLALLALSLLCPPTADAGERNIVQKNIQQRGLESNKPAKPDAISGNTPLQAQGEGVSTVPVLGLAPPEVKSTASVGEAIRVLFTKKMDLASLKKAVSFFGWFLFPKEIPVDIEQTGPDGKEFLIKPLLEPLKPTIAYILKIKASEAKDAANGTAMKDDYEWNFSMKMCADHLEYIPLGDPEFAETACSGKGSGTADYTWPEVKGADYTCRYSKTSGFPPDDTCPSGTTLHRDTVDYYVCFSPLYVEPVCMNGFHWLQGWHLDQFYFGCKADIKLKPCTAPKAEQLNQYGGYHMGDDAVDFCCKYL